MNVFKREVAVALSRQAQPIWFRAVKWTVAVGVAALLWETSYFWWWAGGGPLLGLGVHCFYRWKTHRWTRAWGGWNDLEAGRR
jgi:hypothetical protein